MGMVLTFVFISLYHKFHGISSVRLHGLPLTGVPITDEDAVLEPHVAMKCLVVIIVIMRRRLVLIVIVCFSCLFGCVSVARNK